MGAHLMQQVKEPFSDGAGVVLLKSLADAEKMVTPFTA
jgi:hypothetical protein